MIKYWKVILAREDKIIVVIVESQDKEGSFKMAQHLYPEYCWNEKTANSVEIEFDFGNRMKRPEGKPTFGVDEKLYEKLSGIFN